MARYIDLDEAIRIAIQACVAAVGHGITQIDAVNIATALEDATTADVAPRAEWISVEERVPEPYKLVIVYDKMRGVIVDSALSSGGFTVGFYVTHWMPLPEPPKGD